MGKSIISNQEGQNLFPGIPTLIKGNKSGTPITMKNTSPQIAVTPYGASYMMPNQDYNFAGNSVLELPLRQMGGQDQQDQLMQLLQAYAQMKGMDPQELIQKLQSLPQDQQKQAVQAMAQEIQGQQAAAIQDVDQDQMSEGGEPCFGCYDHYNPSPQAQDLNWYYKQEGGAHMMDDFYQSGGEAFPQAQMYLPNEKPHETRPNFMFQKGGSTDIDQIYQIMKAGGLDMNPRKKKGGKFDPFNFQDYVRKNGGNLNQYQGPEQSQVNLSQPSSGYSTWASAGIPEQVQSSAGYKAVQDANNAAIKMADYNTTTEGTDTAGGTPYTPSKKTRNWGEFNTRGAATEVGALGLLNAATKSMFNNPQPKTPNMSSETYGMYAPANAMGDYMTNTGVLQPNMYGSPQNMGRPTSQTNIAYGNTQYAQMGGKMRNWEDGQIVDSEYLTPEDIFSIYAAGGTIEYI